MQIGKDSELSLNELKGALIRNENGAEFRINDFYVNLNDATKVLVDIRGYDEDFNLEKFSTGVYLSDIKNWSIQLQRGYSND
tara:strand:+ start:182 stop:427 length:246 start_codon:yes stop_codon:yes gene_type:complete